MVSFIFKTVGLKEYIIWIKLIFGIAKIVDYRTGCFKLHNTGMLIIC